MTSPGGSNEEEFNALFELFGNETRRKIIQALWEQFEFQAYVTESRDGVQFGELRKRAGVRDSGNFNYHLKKLEEVLVRKKGDGYVLTPLGYNLMRSIARLTTFEYDVRAEQPIDESCPYCDGTLTAEYRREILSIRCQDCDGLAAGGRFTSIEIPATAGEGLEFTELVDRATLSMFSKLRKAHHGICWDCLHTMDSTVVICPNHERGPDGACTHCDHRYESLIEVSCSRCGTAGKGPLIEYALIHPAALNFFEQFDADPTTAGSWEYRLQALSCGTETVVGTDPKTTEFSFELGDETLWITVQDTEDGLVLSAESTLSIP